jgi:hypothetical protein
MGAVLAVAFADPEALSDFLREVSEILFDPLPSCAFGKPLFLERVTGFVPFSRAGVAGKIPFSVMEKLCEIGNKIVKFLVSEVPDVIF